MRIVRFHLSRDQLDYCRYNLAWMYYKIKQNYCLYLVAVYLSTYCLSFIVQNDDDDDDDYNYHY